MTTPRTGTGQTDPQVRAREFRVGDQVFPFYTDEYHAGTVLAVWPAIGMVDVQFPQGETRMPVEDLQRVNTEVQTPALMSESVPGGVGTVPVSPGPSVTRVAKAHVKKALYWAARDRLYRATQGEIDGGNFHCPKCREPMRKAIYKREDGCSEKLMGCPSCLFLIKRLDIIGHPEFSDRERKSEPFADRRILKAEGVG